MEKGLVIIEKNDTETKGFYIDQDALEFARQNAKTKKRIERMEAKRREAVAKHRKAAKAKAHAKAQRKAYNLDTARYILSRCAVIGGCVWACAAGMIHPIICTPVALFCLCTACVRLGAWFGRAVK